MAHQNKFVPSEWVAVTPADATAVQFHGLLVTVTGDVVFKSQPGSTAVTVPGAPAGLLIPGEVSYVMTATTATVLGAKP